MKKYKWLILIPILAIIIAGAYYAKTFIYYNNKTIYGDRLQGIEEVPIKQDLKTDIINLLAASEEVEHAKIDIKGRIINVMVEVKEDTDDTNAKTIIGDIMIKFTDEQRAFYDMQFFITWQNDSDEDILPIIGYKSRYSEVIVWDGI